MSIFRGQQGFVYAYPGTDSARGFLEVCIALRMLGLRAGAGSSGSDDTMGKSVHHNSRETVIMQRVLHLKTTVQPGGKVEFVSPELEAGQTVDVLGGLLAAVGIISTHRCRFLTPVYAWLRAPLQPEQV